LPVALQGVCWTFQVVALAVAGVESMHNIKHANNPGRCGLHFPRM
jgi:hypothetical protein